jgi:hypothetical protein
MLELKCRASVGILPREHVSMFDFAYEIDIIYVFVSLHLFVWVEYELQKSSWQFFMVNPHLWQYSRVLLVYTRIWQGCDDHNIPQVNPNGIDHAKD